MLAEVVVIVVVQIEIVAAFSGLDFAHFVTTVLPAASTPSSAYSNADSSAQIESVVVEASAVLAETSEAALTYFSGLGSVAKGQIVAPSE